MCAALLSAISAGPSCSWRGDCTQATKRQAPRRTAMITADCVPCLFREIGARHCNNPGRRIRRGRAGRYHCSSGRWWPVMTREDPGECAVARTVHFQRDGWSALWGRCSRLVDAGGELLSQCRRLHLHRRGAVHALAPGEGAKRHAQGLEPPASAPSPAVHGGGADAAICPRSQNRLPGTRRHADPTSHTTTSNRQAPFSSWSVSVGQPLFVPLGGPASVADEQPVYLWGHECVNDVRGVALAQARP